MASEIPEIVYAFGSQLKAFMAVGILLKYFAVSCSSLSEESVDFRYVPLYIPDQVEFRCSLYKNFTLYPGPRGFSWYFTAWESERAAKRREENNLWLLRTY